MFFLVLLRYCMLKVWCFSVHFWGRRHGRRRRLGDATHCHQHHQQMAHHAYTTRQRVNNALATIPARQARLVNLEAWGLVLDYNHTLVPTKRVPEYMFKKQFCCWIAQMRLYAAGGTGFHTVGIARHIRFGYSWWGPRFLQVPCADVSSAPVYWQASLSSLQITDVHRLFPTLVTDQDSEALGRELV
jgi:hypothetical protein